MDENTCILYFTRTPSEESRHKRISNRPRRNNRLIYLMYHWTKACIRRSQIPIVELTQHAQRGESFGERLTNSILEAFKRGYENVIVVGNDCPHLQVQDLRQAEQSLLAGQQILGQNTRGGAYLIGVSRRNFCSQSFKNLPWNSPFLCEALHGHLASKGGCISLMVRQDVNDPLDLSILLHSHLVPRLLRGLCANREDVEPESSSGFMNWIPDSNPFRGPPQHGRA